MKLMSVPAAVLVAQGNRWRHRRKHRSHLTSRPANSADAHPRYKRFECEGDVRAGGVTHVHARSLGEHCFSLLQCPLL